MEKTLGTIMKPIEGFENYAVTEDGQVWSYKSNKFLAPASQQNGYLIIGLTANGARYTRYLHRLVAQTFLLNPNDLPEVNHLDGDKTNCAKWNLAWSTSSTNQLHAYSIGLDSNVGNRHRQAKFTEDEVASICELLKQGVSRKDILNMFPILTYGNLSNISQGNSWCHISYKYGIVPRRWPEYLPFPSDANTTNWVRYKKP